MTSPLRRLGVGCVATPGLPVGPVAALLLVVAGLVSSACVLDGTPDRPVLSAVDPDPGASVFDPFAQAQAIPDADARSDAAPSPDLAQGADLRKDSAADPADPADSGPVPVADDGTPPGPDRCVDVVCDALGPCDGSAACDPDTGLCVTEGLPDGVPCDDGDVCTEHDVCSAGSCGGSPRGCDDDESCTVDSCDAALGGCVSQALADGTECDDGSACTVGDRCAAGRCEPGPSTLFEAVYGGAAQEGARDLLVIPEEAGGGFLVVGRTVNNPQSGSTGTGDGWLMRANTLGELAWDKRFGAAGWDGFNGADVVPSGGFILAGATDAASADGQLDAWLVWVGGEGQLLWQRTVGGALSDVAQDVVAIPGGGFVLTGDTQSFGGGADDPDLYAVGITGGGQIAWEHALGGGGWDWGGAIAATPDGYLVAGANESADRTSQDAWLVHISTAGEVLWDLPFRRGGEDRFIGLAALPGGAGWVMAGATSDTRDEPGDAWAVAVDPSGAQVWDRTLQPGVATAVAADASGGVVLAGHGQQGPWLMKLDTTSGEPIWSRGWPGSNGHVVAVRALPDGGFIAAGSTETAEGGLDVQLVRMNADGVSRCNGVAPP